MDDSTEQEDTKAACGGSEGDFNGVTPSCSSNALGGSGGTTAASSKRKSPHLFQQLVSEFRWMHNNLKHGYNSSGSVKQLQKDSVGYLSTPQTTRESFSMPVDEEMTATSVRTSLRCSARNQSAPTSAREGGKKGHTTPTTSTPGEAAKRGQKKTRWRMMENGEVEAVEEPQAPQTSPDPFAPPDCCYVVRHPKETAGLTEDESCSPSYRYTPRNQLLPCEEVTMLDVYLSDSLGSCTDNDKVTCHGRSPSPDRAGSDDDSGSDLEAVATMATCPSDRRLAKARRASEGILEDLEREAHADPSVIVSDAYEEFLFGIAQLQRQIHQLEQHTSELQKLYQREQSARMHSKGKGQHLSWTRTVEAANTIQFWRTKVTLLRHFEAQYVRAVQHLQEGLPLVDPAKEINTVLSKPNKGSSSPSPLPQSRKHFLQSSRVISAQQQHLQALGGQLTTCWQDSSNLRDELRAFEQAEVRNLHDTFSVAGMDAEHFIASLPPRISAYGLCNSGVSAKSSTRSLDSMDDTHAPPLLLTVQNLSPTSDEEDTHVAAAPTALTAATSHGKYSNLSRATGDSAPLASCVKGAAVADPTTLLNASTYSLSPSLPKRLKCVIQSAVFEVEDGAEENVKSTSGWLSNKASNANRTLTPLTGVVSSSFDAQQQQRRKRERHVTFAVEPEVLDARPRFSAHGRTIELLEQICLDKQVPWSGLTLLQTALNERYSELAAMQDHMEDAEGESLVRAVASAPLCANAPPFRGESEQRETRSQPRAVQCPTITHSPAPTAFAKTTTQEKHSKVKPKECAQCSVM
jgi:hypothetical protein